MSGISSLSGLSSVVQTLTRPADTNSTNRLQQAPVERIDTNSDQVIDKTELSPFLKYVNSKTETTGSDVDRVFQSLDADGDNSVSFQELIANSGTLLDQLKDQLRGAQIGDGQSTSQSNISAEAPPPPPPAPAPAIADSGSDNPLDTVLASLIQQYQAVSTGNSTPSAPSSVNEVV